MLQRNRPEDALERVLRWRETPRLEGLVGRTHDDCDGDLTQQLFVEAMPDGRFHLWCCYPTYREDEDIFGPISTPRFVIPSRLEGPARLLWCALRISQEMSPQKEAPPLVPLPEVEKVFLDLLHVVPWPVGLKTQYAYEDVSEDDAQVSLTIGLSPDGDAWISVGEMYEAYRFRTSAGGGMSVAVRNALVIMAEAIRRHAEEDLIR